MNTPAQTIADTILAQLGGNKFLAMTGVRNMTTTGRDLTLHMPKVHRSVNRVTITLEANDTYSVRFMYVRSMTLTVRHVAELVHAENLRAVFETHTGLRTSL